MISKSIVSILSLLAFIAIPASRMHAADKPEQAAQAAAEQWLAMVDAGKFDESWQAAAAFFQKAVPAAEGSKALQSVRTPLGALVSRKLKSATSTKSLPGAPEGEYVVLQFDTDFATKKGAIE